MHVGRPSAFESVTTAVLRRAAARAIKAPSIHNTQPWRFMLNGQRLDICLDPARRLPVLDPRGRQLLISCGCALLNARVAIAAAGYEPIVERVPPPDVHNVVARLRLGAARPGGASTRLDAAIERRCTNRRRFFGAPLSDGDATRLVRMARGEGVDLVRIHDPAQRRELAELLTLAARVESEDPQYLKELLDWTTDDPARVDGVQAASIPHAGAGAARVAGAAMRQFDLRAMGWLPSAVTLGDECVFALCTDSDDPHAWMRAGEALELVWLELTAAGLQATPIGQVVEVHATHHRLREGLGLPGHPQLLLRVGRAPDVPASGRRAPSDVITENLP
jgi:nitroreductase